MTEEKELVLPARTIETPPTVIGPEARPTVVGHPTPQRSQKVDPRQNVGISPSKQKDPPRQLNPGMGYDPATKQLISEQEFIERRQRIDAIEKKAREVEMRRKRWEGLSEEEILLSEIEIYRAGTLRDPTWSFYPTEDGFQAHLWGVTESVTPNQLAYSRRSKSWHILARGILERLSRKRTRQMDVEQMPRPEVYIEQVALLREIALCHPLGASEVEKAKTMTAGIKEPATQAKTQVHVLNEFLKAELREMATWQMAKAEAEGSEIAAAGVPEDFPSVGREELDNLRAENRYLRGHLEKIQALLTLKEV